MSRLYESEEEIEKVVRAFETCEMPAGDFHHREHLTVAVWYLQTLSREEAVSKIKGSLLRFLDHHGVDRKKYSEEITVFWVDAVAAHLEGIAVDTPLVAKCNQIVLRFNSPIRTPASPVEVEESLAKS